MMRKICVTLLLVAAMVIGLVVYSRGEAQKVEALQKKIDQYEYKGDGVRAHGALRVEGVSLLGQNGEPVQLRGMSTHGLMWYPEYATVRAANTVKAYGGNVMRIALYSDQEMGFVNIPEEAKTALLIAIENLLASDMYVIVDWHVLYDQDPNLHSDAAAQLFDEISRRYAEEPAVLYEICNEPNGDTSWADISGYAERIIPLIRKNAPNAMILVGTPRHCTDLASVVQAPLPYEGILYCYHQYTATMDQTYQRDLTQAREAGLAIFVSEWGVSEESGDGAMAFDAAAEFLDFLNDKNISWVNWSLSNKAETSAALRPATEKLSGWTMEDLSASGQFVFSRLAGKESKE
ncbi:MAG: glycoside hydrolase family 5 protein [Evtepia sp.]